LGQEDAPGYHVLYCEDIGSGASGIQQGINWNNTLAALERRPGAREIYCFIDACRSYENSHKTEGYESPFGPGFRGRRRLATVFYAANEGGATYCVAPESKECDDDFKGGALVTEAIIDGMSRFGAWMKDTAVGPAVYPSALREAIQHRVRRWCGRFPNLNGNTPKIRFDGVGDETPLLAISEPWSMLDVELREAKARLLSHLRRSSCVMVSVTPSSAQVPLRDGRTNYFEGDLLRGEWDAHVTIEPLVGGKRTLTPKRVHLHNPALTAHIDDEEP
jgi:hypothetical protein